MTDTGNSSAPASSAHALAASRRRASYALLAPDARDRLAQVRRRVRAAARRGDTEIVVPAGVNAIDQALCAQGFTVTPVASEDGPYAVVAW